jgi:hypothetical protein
MTPEEKVYENRLRRVAKRQGLVLHRSRRRDVRALDYGHMWLTDAQGVIFESASLAEIEAYLLGD